MKNSILVFFLFLIFHSNIIIGQSSNWKAVTPEKFPTNASGQIHGISRVSQLKFHASNPLKMYAISARGGLFISNDGGANWAVAPGTDFMPYQRLASICIDYSNDQIMYLGTGDNNYYYNGTGVWKSTNGGLTFTQTSLNNNLIVDMIMDPVNPNIIVAATNTGIYKTYNAGSSWALKSANRQFKDLKSKTSPNSRTLYAATRDSAFFRSFDFGDTWTQINTGIILPSGITNGNGCRIAVTPTDTNLIYFGMVNNGGIIYKSTNGGSSFSLVKSSGAPYLTYYTNSSSDVGQGDYNFSMGADRENPNILYVVAHAVWKSVDGGVNWTQLTNWWAKVHTDMHQIFTSPYNNSQLWNTNDGGVWLSTDGGNNWVPKSDGLYGYEIYHGNCSPVRKDMISIGTQDNGELYYTSVGCFTNRGGDWSNNCNFDYRPSGNMVYYTGTNKKRRIVSGSESSYGFPGGSISKFAFNRCNNDLGFISDSNIYRTSTLTLSSPIWTQILYLNKKIMALHSSYADSNRLYVITNDAKIYVSTNALSAAPTFTMYSLPNSTSSAANITSIKTNANVIYITCNTKVYKSINNGSSWTNITYNLPSVNHIGILSDEFFSSSELVFIGSNNSVYYKKQNDISWTLYSNALPSRPTLNDLSIFDDGTNNTALRVSVYGRGMWEAPINTLRPLKADFTADKPALCKDSALHFTDISTGNITSWKWNFPGGSPSTSTLQHPIVNYYNTGIYPVTLTIRNGNDSSVITKQDYVSTLGLSLPFTEGFENNFPPSKWTLTDNNNDGKNWTTGINTGGFGNSQNSLFYDNYSIDASGAKDEIKTPNINLIGYSKASLVFDVAYAFYSSAYSDTLEIKVSSDCGTTYTTIYKKGGLQLSTVSSTSEFIPTASQWRTDTIILNSFTGNSVIFSFQNINDYGNSLYIDNIRINGKVAASAGSDKIICEGNPVQLGITAANGVSYQWVPANGLSSASLSNPVVDTTSSVTTYILTATHNQSGISEKDTVIVTVNPFPNPAGIINGPENVYRNQSNIIYTVPPINHASSYIWNIPSGFIGNSNSNSIVLSSGNTASSGNITVKGLNTCGEGTLGLKEINVNKKLAVKLWLESIYNKNTAMLDKAQDANGNHFGGDTSDYVTIGIAQKAFPWNIFKTYPTALKTNGMAINDISSDISDSNYLVVKHRNSIETWSISPVSFNTDSVFYDFTTSASKAYGNNQKLLLPGKYGIYTGDVNQDALVDGSDISDIETDNNSFVTGYVVTDVNGDGLVDGSDMSIVETNNNNFVQTITP